LLDRHQKVRGMKALTFLVALHVSSCAAAPAPSPKSSQDSTAQPTVASEPPAPSAVTPEARGAAAASPLPCKTPGRISGRQAQTLVEAGATLVDVRSPEEFSEKHVPAALNIPVGDLERRITELPKDREVVVYCRSGMRAARAAQTLEAAGFTVHNMGGVDDWGQPDC